MTLTVWILHFLALVQTVATTKSSWCFKHHHHTTSQQDENACYWQEILPFKNQLQRRQERWEEFQKDYGSKRYRVHDASSSPRKRLWSGRWQDQSWLPVKQSPSKRKGGTIPRPHPLRTDRWNVDIHWMGRRERRCSIHSTKMEFDFHYPSGYVRSYSVLSVNKREVRRSLFGYGKWELWPWGIKFIIQDQNYPFEYIFHAGPHCFKGGDDRSKPLQSSKTRTFKKVCILVFIPYSIGSGLSGYNSL